MAKFSGKIGFIMTKETSPGVWEDLPPIVKHYTGDLQRNTRRIAQSSDQVIDDLTIGNDISILANRFAYDNWLYMKFVEWKGVRLKITSVTVDYPRLTLSIGGVYNG